MFIERKFLIHFEIWPESESEPLFLHGPTPTPQVHNRPKLRLPSPATIYHDAYILKCAIY